MKRIITLALLFCACIFSTQAQTILMSEGFEDGLPETWNNIDQDGDGFSWEVLTADEDLIGTHTGNGCIASASYDYEEEEALEPDNYLITPAITIPANLTAANMPMLSWWVAAQDPEYPADYYEIRISTSGNSADDFTASAVYAEILSTDEWSMHMVDLRNYIGQTIYIAFIHTNCSDEFMMKLDDIAVLYFDTPSIVTTPDALDFGSVMINTTSASLPVNVISALLDGTVSVSCEAPFSISINNNNFSTSQSMTANVSTSLFVRYEPTTEGTDEGVITLTNGTTTATISVSGLAVNCDNALQLPFYEDFEDEITPCWTLRDADHDGMNWMWVNDGYGHESDGYYLSYSYDEEEWEDLLPNDWLITPRIAIPSTGAHISWWAAAYDEAFPDNSYEVRVSTTQDFENSVVIYSDMVTTDEYGLRYTNITDFNGQEVYIAFVHNTNTNLYEESYALVIDDIHIEEGVGIEENTCSPALSVYPNPATEMLNIKGESFDHCMVVNALGQTVSSEPMVNGELHLNISQFANGVYFVKCSGNVGVETIKVVKK